MVNEALFYGMAAGSFVIGGLSVFTCMKWAKAEKAVEREAQHHRDARNDIAGLQSQLRTANAKMAEYAAAHAKRRQILSDAGKKGAAIGNPKRKGVKKGAK